MNFDFMSGAQRPLLGSHGGPGGGPGGGFYSPFSGVSSAIKPQRMAQAVPAPAAPNGWWLNHINHTRGYLEAALAGNEPAAVEALKALWKAVLDWQNLTGSPAAGVLMAEHTALFKMAADALAQGKAENAAAAVDALTGNVESHAKLFPKDPTGFADLFGVHTQLAGTYAMDLAEGRLEDFEATFAEALRNGEELQAFTDANF